ILCPPGADRGGQAEQGPARLAMPPSDQISVERRAGPDRLPRQENRQEGRQAEMNQMASLDIQAGELWTETLAWLSGHILQIILGTAAGAVIVLILLGVRWTGVRICGTD